MQIIIDFNATTGKGDIFWMSPEGDVPFVGMDQNACSYTQCPIKQGERRSYSHKFDTMRKYPAVNFIYYSNEKFTEVFYYVSILQRIFDLRWMLSNAENANEFCCFVIKIKLTK